MHGAFRDGVSIHAPVKGATPSLETVHDGALVSIHAPVKGATSEDVIKPAVIAMFQSTPP